MHVCTQSCLILCDPIYLSLPGSSVHGIFQARVLEWGATAKIILLSLNILTRLRFMWLTCFLILKNLGLNTYKE